MNDPSPAERRIETERLRKEVERLEGEAERGRAAEKQLRFLEARRQSHLANTPLAVIYWDTEFRVLEWNRAAERIFGYTADEAIGRHGCDLLVSAEMRAHVEQIFSELLQQTGGTRSRNQNITKSGRRILCEWYNTPVVDEEGRLVGAASIAQDITEQADTTEALGQSEGLLRSIVENSPYILLMVDRQQRISYVNRVAPNYSRQQVMGQTLSAFVAPEHRSIVEEGVESVFATGRPLEYEVKDLHNRRWFHTKLAPVIDDDKINAVVVITVDVHERREHEAALRESEHRLRLATEQLPAVMWTTDRQLRFTSSIGAALKPMGLAQNEVVGMTLQEFLETDDRTHPALAAAERALAGESVKYMQPLGDRWYQVYTEPLREEDGQIIGVIGIALDITEQTTAELEREKSKETFEILAKNVPGVVYLCRNDDRYSVIYLNNEVEKLLGIPADEFLNDRISFVDLYHPDEASSIPSLVNAAIVQQAPFHLRYRLRHADGHWVWVEERGQGVYDENGALRFLEGCVFDITTKRNAEEALLRSKEELERLVDVRTRELRTANRLLRDDYKRQLELTREIRDREEKFRIICEYNPGPVAITRASDGEILYANQRLAEMAGAARDEIVGRFASEFYDDPQERQRVYEILQRDGQVRDYELRVRRTDGSLIWVSTSMRRMPLEGEDAVLTILLDITERKLFAEQLQSKTRMLRRMLFLHDRDRQLIAYEIHDGIVQYMTGINLFLQAADAKIETNSAGARKDLQTSSQLLGETIEEARRLIDGLRPGVLEEQGVVPAVKYLCEQTERLHNIATEYVDEVEFDRLAPAVEMAIYRIVQEGLNNIVKHSQAKRARVVLSQREDSLVIKIEDWGVGFDPKKVETKRYGLTGIRDRARLLGGKAKIRAAEGEGTRLRVKLPLEDVLLPQGWQQPEVDSDDEGSSSEWVLSK